ncbi:MAG: mannonate dehydratase [Synergistaceae bacterium]|jgi:mannonate dehydratase|nr:mannonate dehydratase [Synergistaceae bacterium]
MVKMVFKWFGEDDNVTLEQISQIPEIYGVTRPMGSLRGDGAAPRYEISGTVEYAAGAGLALEVVEDFTIHEEIKLREGNYSRHIDDFKETIVRFSKSGIKCICYSFSPMSDKSARGSDDQLAVKYAKLGSEGLWRNYELFVAEVVPVAEKHGVNLAIYPDCHSRTTPEMPCLVASERDIDRLLALDKSRSHGVVMWSLGLGCEKFDDFRMMSRKYGAMGRIHFVDVGNLSAGAADMPTLLKTYHSADFDGYMGLRGSTPDWNDSVMRNVASGASYIAGIWNTLDKFNFLDDSGAQAP